MSQPDVGAPAPSARALRRRRWAGSILLSTAGLTSAAWATHGVLSNWPDRSVDRFTSVLSLVPGWLLPVVGISLVRWRPSSRSGVLAVLLGLAWSSWTALTWSGGAFPAWSTAVLVWIRPLSYWLLVSWPSGRVERADTRWLAAYVSAEVVLWGVVPYLFSADYVVTGNENPVAVARLTRLVSISESMTSMIIVPVGAAVLLMSLARRYRRLPESARYLAAPVVVAGALMASWDLALPVTSHIGSLLWDSDQTWTKIGAVYVTSDFLRFALLPILLGVSAVRIHGLAASSSRVRTIDLADSVHPPGFAASVEKAFVGQPVTVAFRGVDGTWLDPTGQRTELGGPDVSVTVIERHGEPIAALQFPYDAPQRPALVEAVVAAAGAGVELQRLEALARQRRDQASRARRALVRVGDDTTRRIQRDLHDGAQQRLVGLMLHVRLALNSGRTDTALATQLHDGVETAREELWTLVDHGSDPTRGRPLDRAIEDLASTVPIPISLDLQVPTDLTDEVQSAAWFLAAEATANAVKHSNADHLRITGALERQGFVVSVADDGAGGAAISEGTGLMGLRRRVELVGGTLAVESADGGGTRVAATFPIGAAP